MKAIDVGLKSLLKVVPSPDDTAAALGNAAVDVVATTRLIVFIEDACAQIASACYDDGEVSVGVRVEVDHLAPAKVGIPLDVKAQLEGVNGRRLIFATEVWQGSTMVMQGHHHRSVVAMTGFSESKVATERSAPVLDFWFDFHSPWCYLASTRIENIARRHGAKLRWRAVHLPKLMDAIDGRRPLEANAPFVSWYRQDLADQAAEMRLPLSHHPDYPLRPSRALRTAILADERGVAKAYVPALLRAYWAEHGDITDLRLLGDIGEACGLERQEIEAAATGPHYRDLLERNLQEAIEAQLFGVPTVVYANKRFFGNDHLTYLDKCLSRAQGA